MSWQQTLDVQLDMQAWWSSSKGPQFQRLSDSMDGSKPEKDPFPLAQFHTEYLMEAAPLFISGDVVDLVRHATKTFKPEPLSEADFIVAPGFALLEKPLLFQDPHNSHERSHLCGKRSISAIWWLPFRDLNKAGVMPKREGIKTVHVKTELAGSDGIVIFLYSRREDFEGDEESQRALDALNMHWYVAYRHDWNFNDDIYAKASQEFYELYTTLQCLWRFLIQKITVTKEEVAPRAVRRRAVAKGYEPSPITVVQLRRAQYQQHAAAGESEREFHVRWMVGGHWRNQWYRSLGPASEPKSHRQVWIDPFVKGPEGAPFKESKKVYVAER